MWWAEGRSGRRRGEPLPLAGSTPSRRRGRRADAGGTVDVQSGVFRSVTFGTSIST